MAATLDGVEASTKTGHPLSLATAESVVSMLGGDESAALVVLIGATAIIAARGIDPLELLVIAREAMEATRRRMAAKLGAEATS